MMDKIEELITPIAVSAVSENDLLAKKLQFIITKGVRNDSRLEQMWQKAFPPYYYRRIYQILCQAWVFSFLLPKIDKRNFTGILETIILSGFCANQNRWYTPRAKQFARVCETQTATV